MAGGESVDDAAIAAGSAGVSPAGDPKKKSPCKSLTYKGFQDAKLLGGEGVRIVSVSQSITESLPTNEYGALEKNC